MALTNNDLSYPFEQIRLEINGIKVDSTCVLGVTNTLKGYLFSTPVDYNCYENSGWALKNGIQLINSKDEFSACITLKYWLVLFEDFKKSFLINSRFELILTRSYSDVSALSVINAVNVTIGKVDLSKIVWKVSHI
jgi:hypothetical protein